MSENKKDDDDKEFDRELMRQYWRADPWNRFSQTVDTIRVLAWFARLAWTVFSSIASGH